jgi:hypothetical protein
MQLPGKSVSLCDIGATWLQVCRRRGHDRIWRFAPRRCSGQRACLSRAAGPDRNAAANFPEVVNANMMRRRGERLGLIKAAE